MSRRRNREDEPTLFDLPLDGPTEKAGPEPEPPAVEPPARRSRPEPPASELQPELPVPEPRIEPRSEFRAEPRPEPRSMPATETIREPPREQEPSPRASEPAPLSMRYLAGLADLAVHAALAIALLFGARLLGVRAGLGDWLPITLFLLVFSFFYTVLPLAFWGQTPGMAWAGVEARGSTGESLTFPQTALRWIGGIVTVALLGLPVLLAIGGRRSLTDRLSDAETVLVD